MAHCGTRPGYLLTESVFFEHSGNNASLDFTESTGVYYTFLFIQVLYIASHSSCEYVQTLHPTWLCSTACRPLSVFSYQNLTFLSNQ